MYKASPTDEIRSMSKFAHGGLMNFPLATFNIYKRASMEMHILTQAAQTP